MFNWIKNSLCYRTARVKLDSSLSYSVQIWESVPQGGVIYPTLFVIFITSITHSSSMHISRALHADDFAMWIAAESTSTCPQHHLPVGDGLVCHHQQPQDRSHLLLPLQVQRELPSLSQKPGNTPGRHPNNLGVKLDKKLTWKPHIHGTEKRATKRLSLMEKLAGTKWGASSNILRQVYTGYVRPVMEYGTAAWATAAKSNTSRLSKVQNAGMRIITGGLKTTPIHTLETTTKIPSLEQRREEKVILEFENLLRFSPLMQLINTSSSQRKTDSKEAASTI
jgi:hypothetical protein